MNIQDYFFTDDRGVAAELRRRLRQVNTDPASAAGAKWIVSDNVDMYPNAIPTSKIMGLSRVVGQVEAMGKLKKVFAARTHDRPVVITGKCGVGKTWAVHVLAEEYGYDVRHINDNMSREIGLDLTTMHVFTRRPACVLLDNCGSTDPLERTRKAEYLSLMRNKRRNQRAILIAIGNEEKHVSLFNRAKPIVVRFRPVDQFHMAKFIGNTKMAFRIAAEANGDMRHALLQARLARESHAGRPDAFLTPASAAAKIFQSPSPINLEQLDKLYSVEPFLVMGYMHEHSVQECKGMHHRSALALWDGSGMHHMVGLSAAALCAATTRRTRRKIARFPSCVAQRGGEKMEMRDLELNFYREIIDDGEFVPRFSETPGGKRKRKA